VVNDTKLGTPAGHDVPEAPAYARDAAVVVAGLDSDLSNGLTGAEAASRLARYGSNQITAEKPPSGCLTDPQ
jgi:Ca2+-transporting ATPase